MHNLNKASTKADITKALKAEGYDAPKDATRKELLKLLEQLTGHDYSSLSPDPGPSEAAPPRRTIIIPSGESKANQGDVYVGYNGKGYQIKRDVEVEVPEEVIEVLRGAQQTIGIQKDDGSLEYRQVQTYPFSIVG